MNHSEPFRVIECDFVDRFNKSDKERSTNRHETARIIQSHFRVIECDFVERFHKSDKERSTKGHETA